MLLLPSKNIALIGHCGAKNNFQYDVPPPSIIDFINDDIMFASGNCMLC